MIKTGGVGDIALNSVTFKYESRNQYVMKDLSLNIANGSKVAFVGVSGCGKSTIIQLLLRFYSPESGKITIDGIDILDYDIHYLRSLYGVVSQEPVLFNGSFADNIKYNLLKASEMDIRSAAQKANATKFILEGDEDMVKNEKN